MSLILSGTDGLSDVDGSAATPAIRGTDANTGIFFPAADTIAFAEGGAECARFDSAGNFGLGVTPSASTLPTIQSEHGVLSGNSGINIIQNSFYNTNFKYTGTGLATRYYQGAGKHEWYNAPSGIAGNAITFTQAMTLDASGNLGIGTTSPVNVAGFSSLTLNDTTGSLIYLQNNGTSAMQIATTTSEASFTAIGASIPMLFAVNGAERARIDTSGNLLVGTTTIVSPNPGFSFSVGNQSQIAIGHLNATTGTYYAYFNYNGSIIGSITQSGTTAVLYNVMSDYRLKNNQVILTGAKDFIMALKPKKWQWWDGSGEGVGFVAHEFMEVAKHSGHGEKDAVDADGKPKYQSIQPSSSEVMANLVSFIQEQQALITQLTARITALESA